VEIEPECRLTLPTGERGEAGRDHRDLVDRRLVDFLEVAQQPARSDARIPARILRAISIVSSSASSRLSGGSSFAVASATRRFPCSSARRKIV
jgi:hypothetical protein